MSDVVLHFIIAIIFKVAKVTTFPLSVNKLTFVHLIYESQDNHKFFNNIKLKTHNIEKWVEFMLCVS